MAQRLERNLGWIAVVLLLLGCLVVLRPFVTALLWAGVLCFSTWPLYVRLLRLLRGRRTVASIAMTVGMMLIVLLPFVVIGLTMADSVKELTAATRQWLDQGPPAAPEWLAKIPVIGTKAASYWASLAADTAKFWRDAQRFLEPLSGRLLKVGLALGAGVLELTLSIFIAFFLFRDGLAIADRLTAGVSRIGGESARHLLMVAGNTVRGVVYGIIGTAIVQAVIAGIGFLIAGVPGSGVLALLTFFLSVLPMGPPLVWLPASLWLFHQGATGWGVFMLIWGAGVSSIDNVVKPWLISQGSAMPFILIFVGVLGGALAFGFIGVFLGPTLLAVGYRLTEEWMATKQNTAPPEAPAETAAD